MSSVPLFGPHHTLTGPFALALNKPDLSVYLVTQGVKHNIYMYCTDPVTAAVIKCQRAMDYVGKGIKLYWKCNMKGRAD